MASNISVEITCGGCGRQLDGDVQVSNKEDIKIVAELCENCIDDYKEAARQNGYNEGQDVGYDSGYKNAKEEATE